MKNLDYDSLKRAANHTIIRHGYLPQKVRKSNFTKLKLFRTSPFYMSVVSFYFEKQAIYEFLKPQNNVEQELIRDIVDIVNSVTDDLNSIYSDIPRLGNQELSIMFAYLSRRIEMIRLMQDIYSVCFSDSFVTHANTVLELAILSLERTTMRILERILDLEYVYINMSAVNE